MSKAYIGDSVYVDYEDGMLKLTTENGVETSNTIYLESEVYAALVNYVSLSLARRAEKLDIMRSRGEL